MPDGVGATAPERSRFTPPTVSELAPYFDQLDIIELIGYGGMSAVYKAVQKNLNRTIALKILPHEISDSHGGLARFQREAKLLAQLNHPNIVQVFDAAQTGPWYFILMEYVAGPNLRQVLGESELPTAEVLRISSLICDGLQYAHNRNVVHRDIKPENVLIDTNGQVKLVDFGLAKSLHGSSERLATTQAGQVVGTPHYLAPEQMETPGDVDHRADLYSLGIMMYEMLTGELPLGNFAPPSRRSKSDPALDDVVLQAMSRDRSNRQQNASELHALLRAAIYRPKDWKPKVANAELRISQRPSSLMKSVWELLLSICSILAAFVGFVGTGNVIDGVFRDPGDRSQVIFGLPLFTAVTLVAWLLSFVFARINVSDVSSWSETRWTQIPSFIPLMTFYALAILMGVAGPSLVIAIVASFPKFVDFEQWSFVGSSFEDADKHSFFTHYWLRVLNVSLIVGIAWNLLLTLLLTKFPNSVHGVFHPTTPTTSTRTVKRIALIVASTCLLAILVSFLMVAEAN